MGRGSVPSFLIHPLDSLIHLQTLQTQTILRKPTTSQQHHGESNGYDSCIPDPTLLHSITIPRFSEAVHPSHCSSPILPILRLSPSSLHFLPSWAPPRQHHGFTPALPSVPLLPDEQDKQTEEGFTVPAPCHHCSAQNAQGPLHLTSSPPSPCLMPSDFHAGPWQASFSPPTLQLGAGRTACL